MKQHKTYKTSWYEFTTGWSGFHLIYEMAGYFEPKPILMIYFIWGKLFLRMPWKHYRKVEIPPDLKGIRTDKLNKLAGKNISRKKKYKKVEYDECESPRYGVYFHENKFCICHGTKIKFISMPWNLEWIRTSYLNHNNGEWIHETKGHYKDFYDDSKWKGILYTESYPYEYTTKYEEVQNCLASINVVEREWRWKWFKWLSWTKFTRKVIDIQFSTDIGDKKGSWKGGTTGCSYDIKPNETPYDCLKRMERERKF
jgi:hypothetical protein